MTQARAARLESAGMSVAESRRKAEWFEQVEHALTADGAAAETMRGYWVPGRIEFLGKHTDYCGGRSLLCAIERGLCLLAAPRADRRIRVHDIRSGEIAVSALDSRIEPAAAHWSNYVTVVARRIAQNFPGADRGVDLAFASDLPPAAGMSSSSALVTAVFLAVSDANDLAARDEYRRNIVDEDALAGYLGAIENGQAFGRLEGGTGVGTSGGSQDHTAILRSRPGAVVQYAFDPVRFEEAVALPYGYCFVIAASGVQSEKTGAARERFNRVSGAAAAILDRWRTTTQRSDTSLAAAVGSAPDAADRIRAYIRTPGAGSYDAGTLVDRFEQFQTESGVIVPAVADALAQDDLTAVGALVDLSQQCAERLLVNQVPETVALTRSARALGAAAASAFGAGFGGSVWALVPEIDAEGFSERWMRAYRTTFSGAADRAEFLITRAGPPATRMEG